MFSKCAQWNDSFWCWAERKFKRCIRFKSVSTRWGFSTFLLALIFFCITIILAILAIEDGQMMGWAYGALILGIISFVVFLSFWGWVTRNKSNEDIEREKTQKLLQSIKTELGSKLDRLIELIEQQQNKPK